MSYKIEFLNKIKYSVRGAQAIAQYGVGAMVDFQEQTLMTAAPGTWENTVPIHDERLEGLLGVTHFRGFSAERVNPIVSYVRFPRWYFCPKCRKFSDIDEWKKDYDKLASKKNKEYDPNMVKKLWCPKCHVPLVVTRIVTICENGHIDDFPWIKWVHAKSKKQLCGAKYLFIQQNNGSSSGLESISVRCSCGAFSNLSGAFNRNAFELLEEKVAGAYDFRCTGNHPWKNCVEKCTCYPKTAQRGSSSVYFPYVISSLVIPPYSNEVTKKIDDSRNYENLFDSLKSLASTLKDLGMDDNVIETQINKKIEEYIEKISEETGLDQKTVKNVLERKINNSQMLEDESSVKYRNDEYTALNGEVVFEKNDSGDFLREETNIDNYKLPFVKKVVLIKKLREVRVLKGFTRVEPLDRNIDSKNSKKIVDVKPEKDRWYPAYDVRGEGIFIEFDNDAIKAWKKCYPNVIERATGLNSKFHKSFFGRNSKKNITSKFILLHTISHLLIKEISFSCGYNIASLQERIYCSDKSTDGVDMQGILIYTAGGDSEGTLGGLVRQGRYDLFPAIFKRAIESAVYCSNDPVCSLSSGQGRDGLNLAACHSCMLVPETSCEEGNVFLDRGMIIGDFDDRRFGFFSKMVYSETKWNYFDSNKETEPVADTDVRIIVINKGESVDSLSFEDIFTDLKIDAEDDEIENINKIIDRIKDLSLKDKPTENAEFMITGHEEVYGCELFWIDKKVMYFSKCSEDDFEAAKDSDWKCFFGALENFDIDGFIKAIGG